MGGNPADIGIERQAAGIGCGLRHREAGAEDRVRADAGLVFGAVQFDHRHIDIALVFGVEAEQAFGDLAVHRVHRLGHALAQIARLVAIAQFDRFVRPGGCARWHRRAAEAAVFQQDIDFDGGIAPAIEDFAAVDVNDRGHGLTLRFMLQCVMV